MHKQICALLLSLFATNIMAAQTVTKSTGQEFDVGLVAGEPFGLSVHIPLGHDHGLALALGDGADSNEDTHFHADYLLYNHGVFNGNTDMRLPVYVGIGALIAEESHYERRGRTDEYENRTVVGLRVPLGLLMSLRRVPFDFFVEVAPTLEIAPNSDFEVEAALGVRYRVR